MPHFEIRRVLDADRAWIDALMLERWSGPTQVANGREYRPAELAGFVAVEEGSLLGYAPFDVIGDTCWVALLQSISEGRGIGSALVRAIVEEGRALGCARVAVITTNDNVRAARLYEHLGFRIAEVRLGAVSASRAIKPSIPLRGESGTPITDEIEYELRLDG
jgi:ribosomal protein S18 acetylase RimI-like enzyme